jgi:ketosteroid isomerase-like protein
LPDHRQTTVKDLFARLSARQFGTLEEVLDDDAVFDVAYSPETSSFANNPERMIEAFGSPGGRS